MDFDINKVNSLASIGDLAYKSMEEYWDQLTAMFKESPEGQARLAVDDDMELTSLNLMEFGFEYIGVSVPQMTTPNVREILEELFPVKLTLLDLEDAKDIIPGLIAFWEFIQREFELRNAKSILRYLSKIEPKYEKIITDPSKYGMAKSVVMGAIEEGVDVTNEKQLGKYFKKYNKSLMAGLPAFLKGDADVLPKEEIQFITLEEKQQEYPAPIADLLTIGRPEDQEWPDYLSFGFTQEHIPGLIQLSIDEEVYKTKNDSFIIYAPIHARRALGQLKAEKAIKPLLKLFPLIDEYDDNWVAEELPIIFGMIGPAAVPLLKKYLAKGGDKLWARVEAAHTLEEIANKHYGARMDCIDILINQLKKYKKNDPTLNGFLISNLIDLKGLEALPVIEQAYNDNMINLRICGDLEDVQIEFGVLEKRKTPPPLRRIPEEFQAAFTGTVATHFSDFPSQRKEDRKTKAKQKQQKQSRKKNRKKKRKRKRK